MRQVVGRMTRDIDAATFAQLRDGFAHAVLDIGTGDGKHVLAEARRRTDTLVIGLDAQPDAMRRSAARAAAKPAKGGTPNAMFVWAAAERLPVELTQITEVHALMPWGSLLRVLAMPELDVLRGFTAVCAPGASLLVTLNLHAWRPPVREVGNTQEPTPVSAMTSLAESYSAAGWQLGSADYLDEEGIAALGTSWTKRLGSARESLSVLALRGVLS